MSGKVLLLFHEAIHIDVMKVKQVIKYIWLEEVVLSVFNLLPDEGALASLDHIIYSYSTSVSVKALVSSANRIMKIREETTYIDFTGC